MLVPMRWRNDRMGYGLAAILLHWTMAVLVVGLFVLGDYMVGLDYYHPWYRAAPWWHQGLGVVLGLLWLLRLAWRLADPPPPPLGAPWERRAARLVHRLLYLLMLAVVVSGYLQSTADGRGVDLFGWLELPAILHGLPGQADLAGAWHRWLAWALILLAALHTLAALKHHFIDRDDSLRRMLLPWR